MKGNSMIVWTKRRNTDYLEYFTCKLQGKYAEDADQSKDGKVISTKHRGSRNRLTRPRLSLENDYDYNDDDD
jgi:hypothetical protein